MPPYDEQAEASVLGAMLLDKSAITTAVEIIHAEDFYYDSHKAIFEGILRLYNKNEPADMITLSDFLKKRAAGGRRRLYLFRQAYLRRRRREQYGSLRQHH